MPRIDITIDPRTGALEVHVQGIAGPACERVLEDVKRLLGPASEEQRTAEYYLRPTQQVRQKSPTC